MEKVCKFRGNRDKSGRGRAPIQRRHECGLPPDVCEEGSACCWRSADFEPRRKSRPHLIGTRGSDRGLSVSLAPNGLARSGMAGGRAAWGFRPAPPLEQGLH